jgi:hypothetical protein
MTDFMAYEVDDTGGAEIEMQGPSSTVNQMVGKSGFSSSPTRALVVLWFVVLGIYWMLGWLFRGSSRGK